MPDPILASSQKVEARWSSRRELELQFGRTQVSRWADIENTGNPKDIDDAICHFIDVATVEAKSRLRGTAAHSIVIAPETLRFNVTRLAAAMLYERRGIKDSNDDEGRHRMSAVKKAVDTWFRRVIAGMIVLVDEQLVTAPTVIEPQLTENERSENDGIMGFENDVWVQS